MRYLSLSFFALLFLGSCADRSPVESTSNLETYRPRFHFTPPAQWMNDPNGLVYVDGEYHLFYQHYPDSNVWGPMHWGHAISKDLVTWEHMPIALYPDSLGYIFSGSAVFDHRNTSGLGSIETPPLVAIFTHHDTTGLNNGTNTFQYQSIAYSLDKGRTWEKYAGNPILPNPGLRDFRDPKVMWFEEQHVWLMTLAVKDRVHFYTSPNLLDWTFLSEFGAENGAHGGVWECPDLFKLNNVDSDSSRWILLVSLNPGGPNGGSATQYFVGEFDGVSFIPDPGFALPDDQAIWLDHGRDNYAGVTWNNIPSEDGRRIFIGWMSNWDYATVVPTEAWRSAMTVPRELMLTRSPSGLRLRSVPVVELETLRNDGFEFPAGRITSGAVLLRPNPGDPFLLEVDISFPASEDLELHLLNVHGDLLRFGFQTDAAEFYIDRSLAGTNDFSDKFSTGLSLMPRISDSDSVRLHAFIDVASIELFADHGSGVMTEIFFPTHPFSALTNGSSEDLRHYGINAWSLSSIWGDD